MIPEQAQSSFPAKSQKQVVDPYCISPEVVDYEIRRGLFLAHNRAKQATNFGIKAIYYEIVRIAAGGEVQVSIIDQACDFVDARLDCADFVLHGLIRLYLQFPDQIHPGLRERIRATILDFKYWPDEPGIDSLCTWTENHYILYASAAYLAGQSLLDESFTNSGHTGREKMTLNRPRILRWLELRFLTGFSEWLSNVYYDEDLTALLSLIDFCQDQEIQQRATMVVDLLLLDVALNSYQGVFGSSHGRSYEDKKKWASNCGMVDTQKLLFGMGQYSAYDNMSAPCFAVSPIYRIPPVIPAIAQDLSRPEMSNRQRMGICLSEAEKWGLGVKNLEDGMHYLTLESYLHPHNATLTLQMFDAFNWWQNNFFAPFKPYRNLLNFLRRSRLLGLLARALEWDACRNTREEVNIETFRTPDYLLSCAQDYRKGYGGDQQHIWQATLGPDAVCFTTHPAHLEDGTPSYWTGSGQLPRAAQVKNVLIAIYKLHKKPALYLPTRHFFTHAWLPKDQFDEVIEKEDWIFARKANGYLGLRSQNPYHWQKKTGDDQGREVIVPGAKNTWICELGRRTTDGDFESFVERICQADLRFEGGNLYYHSPSQGVLEFGWKKPLSKDGEVVRLEQYPRYENPYMQVDFPAQQVTASIDDHELVLNWKDMKRFYC